MDENGINSCYVTEHRTQEEILARVQEEQDKLFLFNFAFQDLLVYLTFENAKAYLNDDVKVSSWWQEDDIVVTPRDEILGYLPFAWEKANNCRGLSAIRSIQHLVTWVWLDGNDELYEWVSDDENYRMYGKPILYRVSEAYGFDWKEHDNDQWTNYEGDEGLSASTVINLL